MKARIEAETVARKLLYTTLTVFVCRIESTQIASEPAMPVLCSWALLILISAAVPTYAAEVMPFDSQPWIENCDAVRTRYPMELQFNVFDLWVFRRTLSGDVEYLLLHTSQEKSDRWFNGGTMYAGLGA